MLNPVPDTVLDALNVVNAPVPAVVAPIFTPSNVVDVAPSAIDVEPTVTLEFVSFALAIDPASIVLVTVPESPVVTIVPVVAGTAMSNVDAVLGPFRFTWPPSVA